MKQLKYKPTALEVPVKNKSARKRLVKMSEEDKKKDKRNAKRLFKALKYIQTPEQKKQDKKDCEYLMSKFQPQIVKNPFKSYLQMGYITKKEAERMVREDKIKLMTEQGVIL